jgi:streptogramin lyase
MKTRTGLALLTVLLLALLPTVADAAGPFPGAPVLDNSLEAQSSRAHGLTLDSHRQIWFAGEATNDGPAFGIAGTIGPGEALVEPAAAALAEGSPLDGIAAGPDGNLWITSGAAEEVLRMTPAGAVTYFPVGIPGTASAALRDPTAIVSGSDGALWFTAEAGDAIGRITTAGVVTSFPLAPGSHPHAIVSAPDGTIWFTEPGAGAVGAITASGTVATYPLPDRAARPDGIAVGAEGGVWFTESNSPHVGVLRPSGQMVEYAAEAAGPIVLGPRHALWFGTKHGIGSISSRGKLGSTYCLEHCDEAVEALVYDPGDALWYAEHPVARGGGNRESTETLAGSIGRYLAPFPDVIVARRATVGRDGKVRVPLTCTGSAGERCRGKSRLRIDGRVVAVAGFSIAVGRTRPLVLRLSPAARRLLGSGRRVESELYLTVPGNLRVMKTFTLRAPSAR